MELDYDVVIVGAGISGINAAHRIQTSNPKCRYTILEARNEVGGTWSLFKYPGIRSDSDLFTFGFAWRPYTGTTRFAGGEQIAQYIQTASEEHGIDKHIQFKYKVKEISWSSEKSAWSITADCNGQAKKVSAGFIILGTGYYDYNQSLEADIPGLDSFKGRTVHPQFWPSDLDYADKKVAIIGSGATAVTLLPNMAKEASRVTMVQRSPSYVMPLPNAVAKFPAWLPRWAKFSISYLRYLILPFIFYKFCIIFPNQAKKYIRKVTSDQLPQTISHDPHFNPSYNPWQQRLCMSPDGDFFEALRSGKGDVVTGKIQSVEAHGIRMESGEQIDADIIVTATGLKLSVIGGAKIILDGKEVKVSDKFLWRGIMLQDIPNMAYVVGYTNASWTLGADCTALVVCRLMKEMERRGVRSVRSDVKGYDNMPVTSLLNLNSSYITKNGHVLPKTADVGPWKARVNYFRDYYFAKFGSLSTGLVYE